MMQPNILVFFTDQQRWDTVGCYNPAVSTTPVLDQLALGAIWRRGQYPARAGAAFVVSAMCCAGAGCDLPDGGDAECVD